LGVIDAKLLWLRLMTPPGRGKVPGVQREAVDGAAGTDRKMLKLYVDVIVCRSKAARCPSRCVHSARSTRWWRNKVEWKQVSIQPGRHMLDQQDTPPTADSIVDMYIRADPTSRPLEACLGPNSRKVAEEPGKITLYFDLITALSYCIVNNIARY